MSGRKKKLRQRMTSKNKFIGLRAREIFDSPVLYGEKPYTEVHVVFSLAGYTLTLRDTRNGVKHEERSKPIGVHAYFDQWLAVADEQVIKNMADNLVESAREGKLKKLEDHRFVGCLV